MVLRAQGATEYLVLLAVVLIIALVSIALLGFFPGMANDSQLQESEIYWKSAAPLAVVESSAAYASPYISYPYVRIRNTGQYPIQITRLLGGNGQSAVNFYPPSMILTPLSGSSKFRISPGEETYVGYPAAIPSVPEQRYIFFNTPGQCFSYGEELCALSLNCKASGGGIAEIPSFGFEYIVYVDGQAVLKREIGKPLRIRCI